MQKSGFHIAGTNIMSDAGSNKVVLMSRNMFGTTTNAGVGFNTSEAAIQDVRVFDDDDYLLNEDTTEHKYLHRNHVDSHSLNQLPDVPQQQLGHHSSNTHEVFSQDNMLSNVSLNGVMDINI